MTAGPDAREWRVEILMPAARQTPRQAAPAAAGA